MLVANVCWDGIGDGLALALPGATGVAASIVLVGEMSSTFAGDVDETATEVESSG